MAAKSENLTILFADMVGFTSLTSLQSRAENAAMLRAYENLLRPIIVRFGGKVIKSIGDALLVTFRSPTDGVRCAMALQDAVFEYSRDKTPQTQLNIRVAVNLGEVRVDRGDVFGEPVNLASRIEGITPADEIYYSESVYLAMNKAEVPSELVGPQTLKGIPEAVNVYRVPRFKATRLVASGEPDGDARLAYPFGGMHRLPGKAASGIPLIMRRTLNAGARLMRRLRGHPVDTEATDTPPAAAVAPTRHAWRWLIGGALGIGAVAGIVIVGNANWGRLSTLGGLAQVLPAAVPSLQERAQPDMAVNRWDKVEQLADAALNQDPKNAYAHLLKGHVLHFRGREEPTLDQYERALRLDRGLTADPRFLANMLDLLNRPGLRSAGDRAAELLQRYAGAAIKKALAERTAKPGFWGRARAAEVLKNMGAEDKIARARLAILDLTEAPGCPRRREAVFTVRELKLREAVPQLRQMTGGNAFKRMFRKDPNACLVDDAQQTIRELEGRPSSPS